jgi:hypothetical protein
MNFGKTHLSDVGSWAKNQKDIVESKIEAIPDIYEEDIQFPGLGQIHLMSDKELVNFFSMVLKARGDVSKVELTLGESYEQKEKQIRVPRSDQLSSIEVAEAARVMTMALVNTEENVIGLTLEISMGPQNVPQSILKVKVSPQTITGPSSWDKNGKALDGDPEFSPRMRIWYSPRA